MSSDKSFLTTVFSHRYQLAKTMDAVAAEPSAATANRLKAQTLIISQWLWELSADNAEVISGLCLYHPQQYSALANRAFCAAVLTRHLCHRLKWHGLSARQLISAALTIDIGLAIAAPELLVGQLDISKLTKKQLQHYKNHPLTAASFLHRHQILSKDYLKYIIEHQELLNGRGFPKGLRHHQIATPAKILSLTAKFSELINNNQHKNTANLRPILKLLAQSSHSYCPDFLRQLVAVTNKPCPTMVVELTGQQFGLILAVEPENNTLSVLELIFDDQQQLVFGEKIQQVNVTKIVQFTNPNSLYDETKFSQVFDQLTPSSVTDLSHCASRLKPSPLLTQLIHQLDVSPPEHQTISALIKQLPELGRQLISQLTKQYPQSQFNDSFHAIKMAGFEQSKALINQLGLANQLNSYEFPARAELSAKIDCVLILCRQATNFTSCVLPHQAAIFALINLAPLYFERRVIEMPARAVTQFKHLTLSDGYSLMSLKPSSQQVKISANLAQHWDKRAPTIKALALLANSSSDSNVYQQEIINIFRLAVCLTHHIFHGINLDDPLMAHQSNALFTKMKLSNKDIKQLINGAIEQAPYCQL
jgi:hypothetical protein